MKQGIFKWGIVLVLISLIIYAGFATYLWWDGEGKKNVIMSYASDLATIPLFELADAGLAFEYLMKHNDTDIILKERISIYSFHARTLSYSSNMLYTLTKDEKYRLFATAMKNIEDFFITAKNKPDSKKILNNNLTVLRQIGDILKKYRSINDLTYMDSEKLLELSNQLKL